MQYDSRGPEAAIPKTLATLTSMLGVLGVIAAVAAVPGGIALLWQLDRTLHAGSYRPATLTVAWAAYRPGTERRLPDYWVVGTVDGHRERLGLFGMMSGIQGWDDLEAQVKPGQQMRVLYDPSLAKARADVPASARVIGYEDDFATRQRARLARTAALVYGPSLMLMVTSLVVGSAVRRPPVASASVTLLVLLGGVVAVFLLRGAQTAVPPAGGLLGRDSWRAVMTGLTVLAAVAVATASGALLWHVLRGKQQRAAALRRRSAAIGFDFLGDATDPEAETEALGRFPLFQSGARRAYRNRMCGSANGYEVLVLDYGRSLSAEAAMSWRTVARLGSLQDRLPVFTLAPRTRAEGTEAPSAIGAVEFGEHSRFSEAYALRGPDAAAIRAAFPEPTLAFLEANPGWSVESLGDRMVVSRGSETVHPARLGAFLADVLRLAGVLHGRPA